MSGAADALDGLVMYLPLRDMPAWLLELLEMRDTLPSPAFAAAVVAAFRTHLAPDFEDPGRDPDLGGPVS